MASMNRHLANLETVFLAGEDRFGGVSSTIIREVASLDGDVFGLCAACGLGRARC